MRLYFRLDAMPSHVPLHVACRISSRYWRIAACGLCLHSELNHKVLLEADSESVCSVNLYRRGDLLHVLSPDPYFLLESVVLNSSPHLHPVKQETRCLLKVGSGLKKC